MYLTWKPYKYIEFPFLQSEKYIPNESQLSLNWNQPPPQKKKKTLVQRYLC